jgi:[acyl-carrier-protein] S-malonyltransferase
VKIAFVFPGQGSQSVGMNRGYSELPVVRETFDEASRILGEDLWGLVSDGPAEQLDRTAYTQPVMLTAGVAVLRAWLASGGEAPAILAGHSLGEYTALVAAGALRFEDAVSLVRYRAQVMQEAVPEGVGGMAAILGLADDAVRQICRDAARGQVLEVANFNAPSQVVVGGHKEAVLRGTELAKQRGAKRTVMLPMSVPVHCSLMRSAAEKLAARLAGVSIAVPSVPVIQNTDVTSYADPAAIKDALARQLHSPVRWVQSVHYLASQGVTHLIECGPGRVLAGLNKRIAQEVVHCTLADAASIQTTLATLR